MLQLEASCVFTSLGSSRVTEIFGSSSSASSEGGAPKAWSFRKGAPLYGACSALSRAVPSEAKEARKQIPGNHNLHILGTLVVTGMGQ